MSAPVAFISARVIVTTMMTTIGVGVTVTITVVRIGTVITAATTTGISCLRYGRPCPLCANGDFDTTTLLIVILLILRLFGGGYYGPSSWLRGGSTELQTLSCSRVFSRRRLLVGV